MRERSLSYGESPYLLLNFAINQNCSKKIAYLFFKVNATVTNESLHDRYTVRKPVHFPC